MDRLVQLNDKLTAFTAPLGRGEFEEDGYVYKVPTGRMPSGVSSLELEPSRKVPGVKGHLKRHWPKYLLAGVGVGTAATIAQIDARNAR